MPKIEILAADITTLDVDAIVNAANERMLGGGGVDGAIHQAAGPGLYEACKSIAEVRPGVRCPTGEARITPGFDLPARFVIHTVGPVWYGGRQGEPALLAACHTNALRLARDNGVTSIAFPAISTGIYGYPLEAAAIVAIEATRAALVEPGTIERVTFACFGERTREAFQAALERI